MPRDGSRIRYSQADSVRALIAHAMLETPEAPARVGSVVLWDHQRDAVARIRAALGEFGGALLADEVGMGKTYVALAIATGYVNPLVIAPAALRDTWARAVTAADARAAWMSLESLSRGASDHPFDLVIVDEAHHARNPETQRYRTLARLSASAHVLLLSATPIHNSRHDLSSLLALFLGAHAGALDSSALARIIVRRTRTSLSSGHRIPDVSPMVSIPGVDDVSVARHILALPPPVPPRDAGVADALVCFALLRQWSSSTGALRSALRKRIGRARALIDALREGRLPSSGDIDAWVVGEDAQQLAFAELLVPVAAGNPPRRDMAELLDGALRHERALVALAASLGSGADEARAAAVRRILSAHPGARVLAFSQFAETIATYWRLLRNESGVCALTAAGGLVAGGRITRTEAIERFSPAANGALAPNVAQAIRLLLTTDLLSEGINLQDASVVVHLDLPWTAARLEQRVGRVARSGSTHESIAVYAMAPPASGEAVIEIQRRLNEKLAIASRSIGAASVALFDDTVMATISPPEAIETLRDITRRWMLDGIAPSAPGSMTVDCAAVRARDAGWLALVRSPRGTRLVASLGDQVGSECALVLKVAVSCDGARNADHGESARAIAEAMQAVERWLAEERAAALAGVTEIEAFRARRHALRRLAGIEALPRFRRMMIDPLSRAARAVATGRMSRGAEQSMSGLLDADPESWLSELGQLTERGHEGASTIAESVESVVALLVLAPE